MHTLSQKSACKEKYKYDLASLKKYFKTIPHHYSFLNRILLLGLFFFPYSFPMELKGKESFLQNSYEQFLQTKGCYRNLIHRDLNPFVFPPFQRRPYGSRLPLEKPDTSGPEKMNAQNLAKWRNGRHKMRLVLLPSLGQTFGSNCCSVADDLDQPQNKGLLLHYINRMRMLKACITIGQ